LVQFLLEQGRDRQARNALGHRSINAPLEDVEEKICGLLRIEETNDYTIFDFPTKLIEETFLAKNTEIEGAVFLRLNGKDPNEALSKLVSSHWPDAKIRPASAKYEVSVEKVRAEKPTLPFAIARAMNRAFSSNCGQRKRVTSGISDNASQAARFSPEEVSKAQQKRPTATA
jgi:hypothetical protein